MTADFSIGWLGTGRMGVAMAARLISNGAAVTVWNRTPSKAAPLKALGATQADKISDLGHCDIVFTMVTSSPDLLAVTLGVICHGDGTTGLPPAWDHLIGSASIMFSLPGGVN